MKEAKKLGFGLMRLPLKEKGNDASIDIEEAKKLVDRFISEGFTYFDTAWMYHKYKSESAAKEILTSRYPRDAYTIATKLHADFFETKEDIENIFNSQLEKIGVSYFDYYLLHDIEESYYEKFTEYDCFNWLAEKKKQGLVKKMGFSFHDTPELLDRVLFEHPEMDFVQLQLNYLDWNSAKIQSANCHKVARKYGKPVIVMEPVKGGVLALLPKQAEQLLGKMHPDWTNAQWAIKFAASLDGVMMVLSGMSNMDQLENNTAFMKDFVPLNEEEKLLLFKCATIIKSDIRIACTGCSYCTDGCPMEIPIPRYFSIYNAANKTAGDAEKQRKNYADITGEKNKASACIECGQCELICPQHLKVIDHLKEVAEFFE